MTRDEAEKFYKETNSPKGRLQFDLEDRQNINMYYCDEYYNYIYEKINEIFLCLKAIDNNINLNTSMDDVMNKILLADLKDKREQLVNVLRNIKDKKEEEVETEDKGITL